MLADTAHIGVMVIGHQRNVVRCTNALQPLSRFHKFERQGDVDEITGDGDVIGVMGLHIGDQFAKHVAAMDHVPLAVPVEIADGAFAREFAQARGWHRAEMRIGQMREQERRH